jgi:NAD(P)-dependent dehydrogenase (short-subunit alcohol dehydrogenase family)
MGIALVTGADRGLGYALSVQLLARGWKVFAGQFMPEWGDLSVLAAQYPAQLALLPLNVGDMDSIHAAAERAAAQTDRLDLVINNAGVLSNTSERTLREPQDYPEMHRQFDVNALGPLRVIEAFLPLTDRSTMKRLCFISSEAASIAATRRTSWYGYCMSKTALNMAVQILFNHLRPEGYTFRLYHPGWMRTFMWGAKDTRATLEPDEAALPALTYFLSDQDEDRLVLRDNQGAEWPW